MRIRSTLVRFSLLFTVANMATGGDAFAEPPAPAKTMTSTSVYQIDGVEVPRAAYEAFRASLSPKLADKAGVEWLEQDQADRHALRQKSPGKAKPNSHQYVINRQPVPKTVYDAFRASLKEVAGTWACAEMTDGGSTTLHATAPDGARYAIREISSTKNGDRSSITVLPSQNP